MKKQTVTYRCGRQIIAGPYLVDPEEVEGEDLD
jgi:hypothetical protein